MRNEAAAGEAATGGSHGQDAFLPMLKRVGLAPMRSPPNTDQVAVGPHIQQSFLYETDGRCEGHVPAGLRRRRSVCFVVLSTIFVYFILKSLSSVFFSGATTASKSAAVDTLGQHIRA